MFTWIIEQKSKILNISDGKITVENKFSGELSKGQSIAHDGACMTIESFDEDSYTFFAMQETFDRTSFSQKEVWDTFNVERCLKISDRLDGHFVSGHIDTIWEVYYIKNKDDNSRIIWIKYDTKYDNLVIEKWSITISGVSLTVIRSDSGYLEVSLIPLTMEITNLWNLDIWDYVNLEFDMLGKYIEKIVKKNMV